MKSILLAKECLGIVEMTSGLVNANLCFASACLNGKL